MPGRGIKVTTDERLVRSWEEEGLEIYIHCDFTECLAEQRVTSKQPVPDGWSKRGRKTFCPTHTK